MDDSLCRPGEYRYRAARYEGAIGVEAVFALDITLRLARPHYELQITAWNRNGRPLGARQKARASALKAALRDEWLRAAEAAGWQSVTITRWGEEQTRYVQSEVW